MLKGEKVMLRATEREDIKRLWELDRDNVDLVILGDNMWEPRSLAMFEKFYEKNLDRPEHTWFVIEADGKIIGDINLHGLDRPHGTAELGIGIYDREYLGKGYGRDAIRLIIDWAFRVHNWRKIWLETAAVNERAIRAYKACGFIEEGRLREHSFHNGQYVDDILMGLLRSEWEAQQSPAKS